MSSNSSPSIEDRFWEQASRELDCDRHEATWARALASADGDDAKTRAIYIKIRASALQREHLLSSAEKSQSSANNSGGVKKESKHFLSFFGSVDKIAFVVIFALVAYAIYHSFGGSKVNSVSSAAMDNMTEVRKNKPIKSIDDVKDLCSVYWDGIRWRMGKTEGENFERYTRDRYGVVVVELAIPVEMVKEFKVTASPSGSVKNRRLEEFMEKYWYQVMSLCEFE